VGTTLAVATGAIVTGTLALSDSQEYEKLDPRSPQARELADRGSTLATVSDVLWATTAVAAGVTVIFLFKTDWGVSPTPGGLALSGRF
jgi:hypothetical protein